MAEYAKTIPDIAAAFGVTRQAIAEWKRHPEFPAKTKRGWNLDRVRRWAEKHGKGKSQATAGGRSKTIDGVTLTEANIRRTLEQAENERIKKERQLVEQAAELEEILFSEDVLSFHAQMVATVTAVHDTLIDALDRALPENSPADQETYAENRNRVMQICSKLKGDVFAAMEEAF